MSRKRHLEAIRSNPEVSVLIVGGGVNGIGLFRELAQQNVDVLLVDRGDFCSGASAASSHMVHGGLRYLENGEFRLVREALRERNLLLDNAPHCVFPLPTTVPIFRWVSGMFNAPLKFLRLRDKPNERGAVVIKLGLMMYDFFTRSYRIMPTHQFFRRAASLARYPKLNPAIVATATYYDAWMPVPERICLEMVLDAHAMYPGAHALNYVSLESAEGGSVTLRDELSGETFSVRPKIVVNAAGPWIDFANKAMRRETHFIGGTKGSHLVLDHPDLHAAIGDTEIFFENEDGRIVLIFPLQDRVLIGTTDIRVDDPDSARCTEDEIDYMLGMIARVFPGIPVDRSQIVYRFSGVRPLPASAASSTGQISRDHSIEVLEAGNGLDFPVLSLVGGKWTTFRAFAEQTADRVLQRLGKRRRGNTEHLAIGGGKDLPRGNQAMLTWVNTVIRATGIAEERMEALFRRYGTRSAQMAAFIMKEADTPLAHRSDFSRREVQFLARNEYIVHLDDFVLRRSLLGMMGHATGPLLVELADVLGDELGWDKKARQDEVTRAAEILKDQHGVSAEVLATGQPEKTRTTKTPGTRRKAGKTTGGTEDTEAKG